MIRGLILILVLSFFAACPARAAERITSYDSQITVNADGSMDVTETIDVVAEGNRIKRGIFRDFPTTYPGMLGTVVRVPFKVLEVTRDGQPEPYHTESRSNGSARLHRR